MKADRLNAQDWLKAGLKALIASGYAGLKAESLARGLGVSRGSFYWHFADIGAFHDAVLQRWQQIAFDNIVEEVEGAPGDRLQTLLNRAFRPDSPLERAVRAWATAEPKARAMVEAIDAKRRGYVERLLAEMGVPPERAAPRARIIYWAYLGHVLSAEKHSSQDWGRIFRELDALARA
jgi:AcrR family transcriptional regulator